MSAQVYVCFSAAYRPEYVQKYTHTHAEINTEIYNPTGLQWGEGGGAFPLLEMPVSR